MAAFPHTVVAPTTRFVLVSDRMPEAGPWSTRKEADDALAMAAAMPAVMGDLPNRGAHCVRVGGRRMRPRRRYGALLDPARHLQDIPMFHFHEDTHDTTRCVRCGKEVRPERGCEIHVHEGGVAILAADDDASGRDEAADLGIWVLGPECQRHVPKTHRRPRTPEL